MDYLLELRKLVGHRPLLMVGAATLIVDEQNRLLLLHRSGNDCWGPPGGAVELGEVVEDAARREACPEPVEGSAKRPGWDLATCRCLAYSPARSCSTFIPTAMKSIT